MKYLVSYGRSGSHYFNGIMLDYLGDLSHWGVLNQKDKRTKTYTHSHDIDTTTKFKDCVYLYRNPVHVVYSAYHADFDTYLKDYEFNGEYNMNYMRREIDKIRRHYDFYLNNSKCIIKFDDLISEDISVWERVFDNFEIELDYEKMKKCIGDNTKPKLQIKINSKYINPKLDNDNYKQGRIDFESKFSDLIIKDTNYLKYDI